MNPPKKKKINKALLKQLKSQLEISTNKENDLILMSQVFNVSIETLKGEFHF